MTQPYNCNVTRIYAVDNGVTIKTADYRRYWAFKRIREDALNIQCARFVCFGIISIDWHTDQSFSSVFNQQQPRFLLQFRYIANQCRICAFLAAHWLLTLSFDDCEKQASALLHLLCDVFHCCYASLYSHAACIVLLLIYTNIFCTPSVYTIETRY